MTLKKSFLKVLFLAAILFLTGYATAGTKSLVKFTYKAIDKNVTKVSLAGSFNNWQPNKDALSFNKTSKLWEIKYPLKKGKYSYKFVENGNNWVADPNAKKFEGDGFGGENSIIVVK